MRFLLILSQFVIVRSKNVCRQWKSDITRLYQNQLFESESLDSLIDIRESIAYQQFVKKMDRELNLRENGYEGLNKEYKRELKYAAGNLMQL